MSKDNFRPFPLHLDIKRKSCPVCVQRQLQDKNLKNRQRESCPQCVPGHIPTTFKILQRVVLFCRKVVLFVSQDTFRPHLENSAEKLSYLCPRTQTDHIWKKLCRKVVLFVSQDTNRPHFENCEKLSYLCPRTQIDLIWQFYEKQVVLFVSKDNTWTHFIFFIQYDSEDNYNHLIYSLLNEKVVQHVS